MYLDRADNLNVYILHAPQDGAFFAQLESHLSILRAQSKIDIWHDGLITGGQNFKEKQAEFLEKTHVVLMLVSIDFLTYFFENHQFLTLFERNKAGNLRILPILVRDCDWREEVNLAKLSALPRNGKFVSNASNFDTIWREIVLEIKAVLQDFQLARTSFEKTLDDASAAFKTAIATGENKLEAIRREIGLVEKSSAAEEITQQSLPFLTHFLTFFEQSNSTTFLEIADFLHPSLKNGKFPEANFLKNSLQPSQLRINMLARPLEISSAKPTNRIQLGFGQTTEAGEEWIFTLRRTQNLGAMPANFRLFFSKNKTEIRISGVSI